MDTTAFRDITFEVRNGIAEIRLNRPEKLNALSWDSWAEIEAAVQSADGDDNARVILFTAEGRGFCAGTDLRTSEREPVERPFTGRAGLTRTRYLGPEQVHSSRKPTIAAVQGPCVGAGLSLALACDLRIIARSARFSAIFVKRGISADTGATWLLPRRVGLEKALRMLWTGDFVSGPDAVAAGLAGEMVEDDELADRARELAHRIANGPTLALELMKRLTYEGLERDMRTQVEQEQFLQQMTAGTEDAKEGRQSFLEKREPVFRGR